MSAPSPALRQRLPAELRICQILNAALSEFARCGYTAARMDDIAKAAGLSKGGLYAHFASKEALLQSLLERLLEHSLDENFRWWPEEVQTLEALVDAFVEHSLGRLALPGVLPTLRLLLAESPRLPPAIKQWYQQVIQQTEKNHERLIRHGIEQGLLPCNSKLLDWSLLMTPLLHSLFMILASGNPLSAEDIEALRPRHKAMLLHLLRPTADSTQTEAQACPLSQGIAKA
ncbi:TetR/AcrR family transcriptional regulator [Comamonas sp. GB3 AK4-5]|uniref:TetR/AcrR family transcriptional regulator n=1 Tax=Comamonas sp. GB3 AK4-5 TaxID=3231487 RepID=UPI00351E6265